MGVGGGGVRLWGSGGSRIGIRDVGCQDLENLHVMAFFLTRRPFVISAGVTPS